MEVQELATIAAEWFETARRATGDTETGPREDGDEYTRVKDDAPEWMNDLCYKAHGDLGPDDWRYDCIRAAVDHISETGDEDSHEFADNYVDVYTGERLRWLASNLNRMGYCDDAVEQGLISAEASIAERVGLGQYMESQEVYSSIWVFLEDLAEEWEDDEEEATV